MKAEFVLFLNSLVVNIVLIHGSNYPRPLEDQNHWFTLAREDLDAAVRVQPNTKTAKNVIIFVGDGMGLSTVTASRIADSTEKGYLAFEKMPHIGVLKTYSANKIVPDSCSTATALFSGIKTNQRIGGVDATVTQNDCKASLVPSARVDSIITWGQKANKSTGFVTTTRVTHATPAALYAHTASRYWECEANMPPNATECKDIARQLIEDLPGRDINVIMGGGRQMLQSNVSNRTNDYIDTWSCYSEDGRDLIQKWIDDKNLRNLKHQFMQNKLDLQNLQDADYLLGVFANGHLNWQHNRSEDPEGMPSLPDMTEAAIKVLQRNRNGYILMVEGGMIDAAHHRGKAKKALSETIEFSETVAKALSMVNLKETLVIVTSDHSHPMVIAGYADRNVQITGIAQNSKTDGVPYTTLLYGIGGENNYKYSVVNQTVQRENPSTVDTDDYEYSQQAGIQTHEVPHDGTDVLIYAQGPMAHLFHSVHEQSYVAHVIAYAAKIGPYANRSESAMPSKASSNSLEMLSYLLVVCGGLRLQHYWF